MEGEEGGGIRLSKRFAGGKTVDAGSSGGGEVDYKTKAGTAWSHSYLNQKPWHPLSYPNQRRKWIAEQTHAQRQRRAEEVAREYSQEQDFFRQTALISKKDREKVEMMKAVSFMYVRPPGYNPESAKAAEVEDERKRGEQNNYSQDPPQDGISGAVLPDAMPEKDRRVEERKKPRPKDVFGRPLPTEEEFEILKNAPRLETGVAGRVKPFGVEVRNVKCLRCGNYGHQSGDRECPLKDAIMPNEEMRLKRDDPLTTIMAHTDPSEPLKWELKQKPGMSPPRGGFKPDDPNQQIVAEDIFDEYGGFLSGDKIPELLMNRSDKPRNKKFKKSKKCKRHSLPTTSYDESSLSSEGKDRRSKKNKKHKKKEAYSYLSTSEDPDSSCPPRNNTCKEESEKLGSDSCHRGNGSRQRHFYSSGDVFEGHRKSGKSRDKRSAASEESDSSRDRKRKKRRPQHSHSSGDDSDRHHRTEKRKHKYSYMSENSHSDSRQHRSTKSGHKHSHPSEDYYSDRRRRSEKNAYEDPRTSKESDSDSHHRNRKSRQKHSRSSEDYYSEKHPRRDKNTREHSRLSDDSDSYYSSKRRRKHSCSSKDESDGHRRSKTSRWRQSHHGH